VVRRPIFQHYEHLPQHTLFKDRRFVICMFMPKPTMRRIVIYVGIASVLFLLALGAEIAARRIPRLMLPQWQIRYFGINSKGLVKEVPDSEIGVLMAPNQHTPIHTLDFNYILRTDSKGFPNKDPWPTRADIVFLGDSLIIGVGVGLEGSFAQLIADQVPNERLVNLGVSAAGPERQYAIYRRFGAALHPRLVVSFLYSASDFRNDFLFKNWLREGNNVDYDSYRFGYRRAHAKKRSIFRPGRLFESSWLLGMAREVVMRSKSGENHIPDRYSFPDRGEVMFDRRKLEFAAQAVAANDPGVDAMVDALEKLRDLVEHDKAEFAVMLIPSKEELFGVSASLTAHNIVSRTRQRLQEAKFSVLDLYPAILKAGAKQSPYFTRDIHLNGYGNRIVAEQFVTWYRNHGSGKGL
jgi:hypothetical protein